MFDDVIQKPRKTHEKKTKWGENDKFSKSAKRAGKRVREDLDEDWRSEVRNVSQYDVRDSLDMN